MYDISKKNLKKSMKFNFYACFLLLGFLFLILMGSIIIFNYIKAKSLDSTTMSTFVDVNMTYEDSGEMYSSTYHYEVNGIEYACSSNSLSSINPGTKNTIVHFDSKDPSKCIADGQITQDYMWLLFMLIPIIAIAVGIINIKKISKRLKIINELNKNGKLVKNLEYSLEETGTIINGIPAVKLVVNYVLPSGAAIKLYSDLIIDGKTSDSDSFVDLVIDESNPNNYYIYFEINRLSGNLPQDYSTSNDSYKNNQTQNIQQDSNNN